MSNSIVSIPVSDTKIVRTMFTFLHESAHQRKSECLARPALPYQESVKNTTGSLIKRYSFGTKTKPETIDPNLAEKIMKINFEDVEAWDLIIKCLEVAAANCQVRLSEDNYKLKRPWFPKSCGNYQLQLTAQKMKKMEECQKRLHRKSMYQCCSENENIKDETLGI